MNLESETISFLNSFSLDPSCFNDPGPFGKNTRIRNTVLNENTKNVVGPVMWPSGFGFCSINYSMEPDTEPKPRIHKKNSILYTFFTSKPKFM